MSAGTRELEVTLEQLSRMHRALAELHGERHRYSASWLAVMSEGPLEEIRRLEETVDRLTGRAAMKIEASPLSIRVVGAGLEWPGSPVSILSSFADTLRKGVQTIAEMVLTGDLASRPTRALNEACDLRLVGLATGSLVLSVELPTSPQSGLWTSQEAEAAKEGLDLLLAGVSWAGAESEAAELDRLVPREDLRLGVLAQVKRLLPRPRGKVTGVHLSGALLHQRAVILTKKTTARVDAAIDAIASTTTVTYEGELREVDLDHRTAVVRRVDGESLEVSCEYAPELDEIVLDALNKRVTITGSRRVAASRQRATLKVHRMAILEGDTSEED
jgi:hypothetical protein